MLTSPARADTSLLPSMPSILRSPAVSLTSMFVRRGSSMRIVGPSFQGVSVRTVARDAFTSIRRVTSAPLPRSVPADPDVVVLRRHNLVLAGGQLEAHGPAGHELALGHLRLGNSSSQQASPTPPSPESQSSAYSASCEPYERRHRKDARQFQRNSKVFLAPGLVPGA